MPTATKTVFLAFSALVLAAAFFTVVAAATVFIHFAITVIVAFVAANFSHWSARGAGAPNATTAGLGARSTRSLAVLGLAIGALLGKTFTFNTVAVGAVSVVLTGILATAVHTGLSQRARLTVSTAYRSDAFTCSAKVAFWAMLRPLAFRFITGCCSTSAQEEESGPKKKTFHAAKIH